MPDKKREDDEKESYDNCESSHKKPEKLFQTGRIRNIGKSTLSFRQVCAKSNYINKFYTKNILKSTKCKAKDAILVKAKR